MTPNRQVRLELDVVEALEADPANAGLSLSAAANRALREARLSRPDATTRTSTTPPHVSRETLARRHAGSGVRLPPNECPHPITRRIGNQCAVCGKALR